MFTWDKFDPADSKAARRSLLTFASLTLLVANLTFISNHVSIFGFMIGVSQSELVALGRILTAIFLVVYLLKEAPSLIDWGQKVSKTNTSRKHARETIALQENWGYYNEDDRYEDSPQGEFMNLSDDQELEIKKLDLKFYKYKFFFESLTTFILVFSVPTTLGIIAITHPYSLNSLVTAASMHKNDHTLIWCFADFCLVRK